MNAWDALTVVLCWLTFVTGVVIVVTAGVLCAFQAHRDNLELEAWKHQVDPPSYRREYVESTSRR